MCFSNMCPKSASTVLVDIIGTDNIGKKPSRVKPIPTLLSQLGMLIRFESTRTSIVMTIRAGLPNAKAIPFTAAP